MNTNSEKQSEIDLYLLGDAAGTDFDREAFEARMLEDIELALQVADTVAEHQAVRQSLNRSVVVSEPARQDWSGVAIALLVTSAALLVAFWVSTNNQDQPELVSSDESLSVVAENWLALGNSTDEMQIQAEQIASESANNDYLMADAFPLELSAEQEDESEDWMLSAATDFYADLDS